MSLINCKIVIQLKYFLVPGTVANQVPTFTTTFIKTLCSIRNFINSREYKTA